MPTRFQLVLFSVPLFALSTLSACADGPPVDVTKRVIEADAKHVVEVSRQLEVALDTKVKPGDIQWHPGFAAACTAARASGKPVLLFQLLGKLDEEAT